jgi:hypothetical protein
MLPLSSGLKRKSCNKPKRSRQQAQLCSLEKSTASILKIEENVKQETRKKQESACFLQVFLHGLLFNPENRGSKFL